MDSFILSNHCKLNGKGNKQAQHEIHIFLLPLNPNTETIKSYYQAVDDWNTNHQTEYTDKFGDFRMKACHLCLIYREKGTFEEKPVFVMQSSVYIKSDDMSEIIKECHKQAKYFQDKGFTILREKIEAMAYGIDGIPISSSDVIKYDDNEFTKSPYFEFHIKCKFEKDGDNTPLTDENISLLKSCANRISAKYGSPCPLSYNINPHQFGHDCAGNQRFINIRFRNIGLEEIDINLRNIKLIMESEGIYIIKRISEYVWYDTNPNVDQGWIDFDFGEEKELISHLCSATNQHN